MDEDSSLPALLVTAGLFQFSNLKSRCLHACRRPETFLRLHYRRDSAPPSPSAYAATSLSRCCWALMLLMVAAGIASLLWMAPLALVMVAEKVAAKGERLVAPLGAILITLGLADLLVR